MRNWTNWTSSVHRRMRTRMISRRGSSGSGAGPPSPSCGASDRGGGPGVSEAAGRPSGGRAATARPSRGAGEVAGDRRPGGGAAGRQARGTRAVGGGCGGQSGGPAILRRQPGGGAAARFQLAGSRCLLRTLETLSKFRRDGDALQADPVATDESHAPAEGEHPGESSWPAQADEPADAAFRDIEPRRPAEEPVGNHFPLSPTAPPSVRPGLLTTAVNILPLRNVLLVATLRRISAGHFPRRVPLEVPVPETLAGCPWPRPS